MRSLTTRTISALGSVEAIQRSENSDASGLYLFDSPFIERKSSETEVVVDREGVMTRRGSTFDLSPPGPGSTFVPFPPTRTLQTCEKISDFHSCN